MLFWTLNHIMTTNLYPQLRPLDIRRHIQDGHPYILLRDPLQLNGGPILVPQPLAAALAYCDGTLDASGIAAAFTRQHNIPLKVSVVEDLIAALDKALLLENERAAQAKEKALQSYRDAPFRTPMLAGHGYPDDPDDLHEMLQAYLDGAAPPAQPAKSWPALAGIVSPHIDYRRGGEVYARVWKEAAEAIKAADLVIMFGTDHYGDDPFTLTRQDYATPYGALPTARPIVDGLAKIVGEEAAFAGELRHRDEHSLELVALWLHHMRDGKPVDVVPILTGSLRRFSAIGSTPDDDPTLGRIIDLLARECRERRVLVVASGDLAHVGPEFGGAPLDTTGRKILRSDDQTLIEAMREGDAGSFYMAIERMQNRNNVCGVSPFYLTMRMLSDGREEPLTGSLTSYASCPADADNTSAVTICGMTYT